MTHWLLLGLLWFLVAACVAWIVCLGISASRGRDLRPPTESWEERNARLHHDLRRACSTFRYERTEKNVAP